MAKLKRNKNLDIAPSKEEKITVGQVILAIILLICTLFAFMPVELTFVAAFTDEKSIAVNGLRFWPKDWSLNGMAAVLKYGKQLAQSYLVTIFVTVVGTFMGLLFMSMFAYSISRKDFRLSKFLSIL